MTLSHVALANESLTLAWKLSSRTKRHDNGFCGRTNLLSNAVADCDLPWHKQPLWWNSAVLLDSMPETLLLCVTSRVQPSMASESAWVDGVSVWCTFRHGQPRLFHWIHNHSHILWLNNKSRMISIDTWCDIRPIHWVWSNSHPRGNLTHWDQRLPKAHSTRTIHQTSLWNGKWQFRLTASQITRLMLWSRNLPIHERVWRLNARRTK